MEIYLQLQYLEKYENHITKRDIDIHKTTCHNRQNADFN
jgi:hypothetical protein